MIDLVVEAVSAFAYSLFMWTFWCIIILIAIRVLYEIVMAVCIIVAWVRMVNNSCDKQYDRYETAHDWDTRYYD